MVGPCSLFTAAFPHSHGDLGRRAFEASPVTPYPAFHGVFPNCPILNHTSSPSRTAFLSQLFSFPADILHRTLSASYSELLLGPVRSLGTFSYPSTTALMAAYCDVTHYTCGVHVCISTQNSELLEASRLVLEVRVDPESHYIGAQ